MDYLEDFAIRNLLSIGVLIAIIATATWFQDMYVLPTFAGVISPVLLKGSAWMKVGVPAGITVILSVLLAVWFREPLVLLPGLTISVYLVLIAGLVMKGMTYIGKSNNAIESDA